MKKFIVHAMLALVAVSPLFRGLFFTFETYGFLALIALLSFIYFLSKIKNNEPIHINKTFLILSILIVSAYALSFINAVNPRENLGVVLLFAELTIIFLVLYDHFFEKQRLFAAETMGMVVAVGFICAVIGLEALTYSFGFLDITIFSKRLGSTFQYTNTASIYFVICILFSLTLINNMKNPILKAALSGAGNIFIFALFMTGSRGGYLTGMAIISLFLLLQPAGNKFRGVINLVIMLVPLFVSFGKFGESTSNHDYLTATKWLVVSCVLSAILYLFYYIIDSVIQKRIFKEDEIKLPKRLSLAPYIVFAIAVVIVVVFWDQFITILPDVLSSRLKNMSLADPNILFRIEFDKDALRLIKDNWLFGIGGGGWLAAYQSVQDVPYTANFVHNNYLQIFVESGILGFISYSAIIVLVCVSTFITFLKTADKTHKALISGILCGIIALAFHSSFDFDLTFVSLLMLFWVLLTAASVRQAGDQNRNEIAPEIAVEGRTKPSGRKNILALAIVPIAISALLLSMYALHFTGAYNAKTGKEYSKSKSYKTAVLYYEEANRLDPLNPSYLFELSKVYNYLAQNSKSDEDHKKWIEKAIWAGEEGISLNRYYPPQLKTLILIYRNERMYPEVLNHAKKLVQYQRYRSANFESLAIAYIDAAKFHIQKKEPEKAKNLLEEFVSKKEDFFFEKPSLGIPYNMNEKQIESNSIQNPSMEKYFIEAQNLLSSNLRGKT
jgi:tetratricopeptide (TPR) repeat protein